MIDYEKTYKEALERAKLAIKECGDNKGRISMIESIFPELGESEDERIRKMIINTLNRDKILTEDEAYDCIAWLEKQKSVGEIVERCKNSWYNEGKIAGMADGLTDDEKYQQGWHDALETWKDIRLEVYQQASGNRHEPNYSDDSTKMFSLNDIDEIIEKISEQKHTDMVKPKFKVGDWIVQENIGVYKIIEVCESWYEVISYINGRQYSIAFDYEYMCHLWTIQDAKDGDVLAAQECYVIFKEIDGLNIKCHCTYHYMGFNPSFHINTLQNKTAFQPATKEQRELLFKKMKESGYEWNPDTKELKKVEQKPTWSDDDLIKEIESRGYKVEEEE